MTRLAKTTTSHESFAHRILWECAQQHLAHAKKEVQGSWYFHLSALLMAYLAYEAYLNYLGETVAPEVWAKARDVFSRDPYRGTHGKLVLLLERYNLAQPDFQSRPSSCVFELRALRDEVVHARPHRTKHVALHRADKLPPPAPGWLHHLVTKARANRLLGDLEAFIEDLHKRFRSTEDGHLLWPTVLKGSLAFGHGSTELQANPTPNPDARKKRARRLA